MHLSTQDFLTIAGSILGPILTFMGFMWHHFNNSMGELKNDIKRVEEKVGAEIKDVRADIKNVEDRLGAEIKDVRADIKRVEEKVDSVRDRVSRIEGQLVPAKVISFEETRPQSTARQTQSKVAKAN